MIKKINYYQKQENYNTREKNLKLILYSDSYKIAQEDISFLRSDDMRGDRMLLEITKPELVLDK